jgi:hypothetical protein
VEETDYTREPDGYLLEDIILADIARGAGVSELGAPRRLRIDPRGGYGKSGPFASEAG